MGAARAVRTAMLLVLLVLLVLLGAVAVPGVARAADTAAGAVRGGDALFSDSGTRCTVGFNATDGTDFFGLVPGYCGDTGTRWYADPGRTVPVGETVSSHFPGGNYAAIRYTNPDLTYPSEVNSYGGGGAVRIERAVEPQVGMAVCRSGPTTGWHCGTIRQINVSVNYPEGTVDGLFSADICAEPGDNGGPAVSGNAAVGMLVGGTGDCASGGLTYYQPVVEPLGALGLTIGY
ncbi:S1 family peptidase [Streptomyces sp. NPDC048172]|uniref:S1 family peptidase n=1 Tax=Streptomyces sp. NPDC048172 TaxID=3365505 RepID=UPI00371EC0EB